MVRYFIGLIIYLSFSLNLNANKKILLLNSYHPGFTWTDGITSRIIEAVSERSDINLYIEYEDAKRFSDTNFIMRFKEYLLKTKILIQRGEFVFDYVIIEKCNLDLNAFPKNAIYINKPKKLLEIYRNEAIALVLFILILFTIITFLISSYIRRVRAEKKYTESDSRFKEFAELLPQIVFETDLKGNILFVNNHALEKFGYTREDMKQGINLFNFVIQEDIERVKSNLVKLIEKNLHSVSSYTVVDRSGTRYIYQFHPNLIEKNGKPFGIRGIGVDITRQKEFEQELIDARKRAEESDRLKTAFLANMSHEIRTPLNSIVGFSYLMSERNLSEEDIKKMSKYIRNSSDHLLLLINDIIDISKIEAGQLEIKFNNVNVSEVFSEIHSYTEREKARSDKEHINIFFNLNPNKDSIVIRTDVLRLKQVLYNLINNALKFTEKGIIECGYQLEDGMITFYVKDTGIGINNELGNKIFNRFIKISSKDGKLYPGFGLGLSISKQLAGFLGGKLWYHSNEDIGTTFYFSLPLNNT